jgi:chemotaxis family two-component system sensor kinase Cph1
MASHDLQEPVRKVKMFTFRLYEENKDKLDITSKQWAEKAISAAERMQRMIGDILSLSSLRDEVELRPTNLQEVMKEVETDLEVKIQERSAVIQHRDLPVVNGYHEYLVLLFLNLVNNAIKFSEKQPIIRILAEQKEKSVVIHVKDNGIGMRQEETSDIFNAFHRLNKKGAYDGSGIGLAICKKIVDIHKGTLTVESALGEGTTFMIELPQQENDA